MSVMLAPAKGAYPSLAGRAVLITGGSRGLGRAMALGLAEQGARVAVTGVHDGVALRRIDAELAERAGAARHLALVADVCSPDQSGRAIARVIEAFGRIDVLVNNAGVGMRLISDTYIEAPRRFWEVDPEAWRAIVDTNVNGPFNMA